MYYVYWINSEQRNYIGATTDPKKRLRQHNGEIQGGAYKTSKAGPWSYECVINGFRTWREALQFEWAFKFYTKHCRSVETIKTCLFRLLEKERWTSNSPNSSDVPLSITWKPECYGFPCIEKFKSVEYKFRNYKPQKKIMGVY